MPVLLRHWSLALACDAVVALPFAVGPSLDTDLALVPGADTFLAVAVAGDRKIVVALAGGDRSRAQVGTIDLATLP